MNSRWARVVRGTIAAGVATFVAAFSHALGGDAAPSWVGVGASFVLSVAICTVLSGRALSWWRLAASVAVSQVLFHVLFSGAPAAPAASVAHDHGGTAITALSMPAMDGHADRMILAHVIAGIITLLALRFGERAFWSVTDSARLVVARVLLVVAPVAAAPARVILPALRTALAPRPIHVPSRHRHRGPPLRFVSI